MRRCVLWICTWLLRFSDGCASLAVCGIKTWEPMTVAPQPCEQTYERVALTADQVYMPTAEDVAFAMLVGHNEQHGIFVVQDADVQELHGARAMAFRLDATRSPA
jgi:hypothetical protein